MHLPGDGGLDRLDRFVDVEQSNLRRRYRCHGSIREWPGGEWGSRPARPTVGSGVNVAAEDIFELIFESLEVSQPRCTPSRRHEEVTSLPGVRLATGEVAEDLKPCDAVLFAEPGELGSFRRASPGFPSALLTHLNGSLEPSLRSPPSNRPFPPGRISQSRPSVLEGFLKRGGDEAVTCSVSLSGKRSAHTTSHRVR